MVTTSAGSAASDPLGAAHQILARTDSLATPADAAGVAALWDAIRQIEEALAALPLQAADGAMPARLAERCERLRARLLRIGGEPAAQAALADCCRSELVHLDERAAALIADTLEPTQDLVPRLRLAAARADWLQALVARQDGAPAADPLEEARAEIDQTLAAARAIDPHGEIAVAAERLAGRAFALHAQRLAAHADRLTAAPGDCRALVEILRQLGDARLALARAPRPYAADPERVQTDRLLHEGEQRTARALSARLAAAAPEEANACLADWAPELDERARELLLAAEEVPPGTAARQMARMSEEIRAFLELAAAGQGAGGGRRRRHSPVPRTLLRTERRLQNEHQERLLQHRLERMLGRRGVSALENGILGLILAVVGILLYEAIARPSPEVRVLLMWVDTAICAVFLADFLLRLALAPCRGRYLRRHLLVDLLPSIPYGLVAHGLERLNLLRGVRLLRFLRLPRLLRYVRLARPLVQMVRVVIFLVRGTDRLVQRHASALNRNVIVFEPRRTVPPQPARERLRLLASRCRSRERELRRECDPELCRALLRRALSELEARVEAAAEWAVGDAGPVPRDSEDRPKREARLEEIIAFLTHLEAAQVEATVGIGFARRTARALRLFQVPLLRHIPPFSTLARIGARAADPLQATAALGRATGRLGERALGAIHWFADLSGTVTAPQFLEMIGAALVRTTTGPARKLITIGGGFLLLDWTFALFRFTWLRQLSQPLERVVGLPLFLLGGACLVALLLGQWFRRVASEASDFYERTAEAHFLALMEDVKEANAGEDLRVVHERVLWPEERILARTPRAEPAPEAVGRLLRRLAEAVPVPDASRADAPPPPATILPEHADGAYYWLLEDRVLAMFRDYLDGALLHKSDTKSTNQLLGNLNVHRIVHERLALGRRERQRLQRLDLDRHRGLLGGPYLWFWFIAHSVAQRTAKLLIEYNRFALALDEVRFVDEARRAAFEAWLARAPQSRKAALCGPEGTYVSTEFTALSFLSIDPRRDRALAERYGARVLERLRQDRRMLIRTLFGTYPLHRRPREQRTFNPYHYYQRCLAGGLILVYPLRVAWWAARRAARGGATLLRVARELLNPERVEEQANNEAGFDVAERKIARMRMPVLMEVMRLRSLFDVEYLGLTLPGESRCPAEAVGCGHDLDWVGAGGAERDAFQQLRTDRHNALRRLAGMLDELALSEARLPAYLDGLRPGLGRRAREARRAAVIAYAIDYHGLRSFLTGQEEIESIWAGPIENPELLAGFGVCRRAAAFVSSLPRRRFGLRRDPRRTEFDRVLARSRFAGASRRQRALLYRSVQADLDGVARKVRALGNTDDAGDARRRARRILDEVLARPHPWTDELVVLRMIQTMAILDIRNYRALVYQLGGYDDRTDRTDRSDGSDPSDPSDPPDPSVHRVGSRA